MFCVLKIIHDAPKIGSSPGGVNTFLFLNSVSSLEQNFYHFPETHTNILK